MNGREGPGGRELGGVETGVLFFAVASGVEDDEGGGLWRALWKSVGVEDKCGDMNGPFEDGHGGHGGIRERMLNQKTRGNNGRRATA